EGWTNGRVTRVVRGTVHRMQMSITRFWKGLIFEKSIAQAKEIAKLKKRVKKLEKRRKSRPAGLRRLNKVGLSKQVESSEGKDSLGAREDAFKHGRSIKDIDQDATISLIDEAQGRMHDADMFGGDNLEGNEVIVDVREKIIKKEVSTADPVTTVGEVVTTASLEDSAAPTTATTANVDDELTLEKTLIAIKAAKPKVISTAITIPRAKGIVFHEQVQAHIPTVSSSKDKGKAKMIEPEKPLKKKDQIALDEEVARRLEAEMKGKIEEEERISREKDKANRAVIKEWDDVQAAMIHLSHEVFLLSLADDARQRWIDEGDCNITTWKELRSPSGRRIVTSQRATMLYALTVNPTFYASCVKQFWTTTKVKKVNGQEQIQTLVDKQKVIITEESIKRGHIFYDPQGMAKHKKIYVISSHTKKIIGDMRRQGHGFSGNVTPLLETMMVNAQEEVGEGLGLHTASHHTPTDTQPSSSKPQKKIKPKRKQMQATEVHSPSSEIHIVLNLEEAKIAQAKEIAKLKKKVKKLEKKGKLRPAWLRRLKKVGLSKQVESFEEKDSLGAQEDAFIEGRSIEDIDQDAEIALVDEAQGRMHDANMFGVDDLEGNEMIVDMREKIIEKEVSTADLVTTTDEVVTAASVEDSVAPTTATTANIDDELTIAKTLIAIKGAKPKVISTAIKTPRAKELEKPLKKKDQIALDEEVARRLKAEMKAKIEEEERISREKDEANRAVIEEWDDVQATIDADRPDQKQATHKGTAQKSYVYLHENIEGFKQKDFKGKSFDDIKKIFDKVYKRVNTFVDIDTENVEKSLKKTQEEGGSKRAGQELEQESATKQKLAEHEQAKVADDVTAELKNA
nr:hypothetical protein [Tanacetum cinerariifolium]